MKDRSNVRCFLPRSEATKLLAFLLEVRRVWPDHYDATDDFAKSIDEAYRVIRERMRNGGPGWTQKEWKR